MSRSSFVLAAALLCGCLDFDVFDTEPTTGSTTSSGGGGSGAGGSGGSGPGGGGGGTTTTGMGGMGGSGGGVELPPCGGLQDDFDGGASLMWNPFMGSFTNDVARAQPPQSLFRLDVSEATTLQDCAIHIQFLETVNAGQMYFEWSLAGDFNYVLRILTNDQTLTRIDLTNDMGMITNPTLLDPDPFVTGWARVANVGGDYRIETAESSNGPWTLRAEVPAASAPQWLSQPGVAEFGIYNATGGPVAFDNFNTP
jgi:hypothetical protein